MSFVRGGLRDLSISRTSFNWGIPVPDAPGHVMYVWLDALNNYVTACGFPDETAPRWHYWPADVHFVGKDIIRFHAVYWPAFLMAAGLPVPRRVTSNGWWTVDGEKMSKSLGNVIEPRELVGSFGLDQVRYFLLREKPFGGDGTLSATRRSSRRINVELANDLGNLAQRSLSLIARNCDGRLPGRGRCHRGRRGTAGGGRGAAGVRCAAAGPPGVPRGAGGGLEGDPRRQWLHRPPGALGAAHDRSGADGARCCACWRTCCGSIATVLQPFMPGSMARMLDQLGVPADARQLADCLGRRRIAGRQCRVCRPPQGVFPRYVGATAGP